MTIEEVADVENVRAAVKKYCSGKTRYKDVCRIKENYDAVCEDVRRIILNGFYRCGKPTEFLRREGGKIRHITYSRDYPDALIRHCFTRKFKAILEPQMQVGISSTMKERGTSYAVKLAKQYIQQDRYTYYLCEDIHHYFASIDKEVLCGIIWQYSGADKTVMAVVRQMLSLCEEGISIGTYDSQLWANVYLMPLDDALSERFPNVQYIRYCDNLYLFGNDVSELHRAHQFIKGFSRKLRLKMNPCEFGRCDKGVRILSAKIFPTHSRVRRRIREAMKRASVSALPAYFGFLIEADCKHLIRKRMVRKFGELIDIPPYVAEFLSDKWRLDDLIGKSIVIWDCRIEEGQFCKRDGTKRDRVKVSFSFMGEEKRYIFFSSSAPILHYCRAFEADKQKYLPIELKLEKNNRQYYFVS